MAPKPRSAYFTKFEATIVSLKWEVGVQSYRLGNLGLPSTLCRFLRVRINNKRLLIKYLVNNYLKRQRNQRSYCQHLLDHGESKGLSEKHLLLPH